MTQRRQLWAGGWYRFSRYEIRDGAIRPARNADLSWYDPWEIYRISEKDKGTPPPYQSLLALVLSMGAVFDEAEMRWRLDKTAESLQCSEQNEILDWCSRFGLLGIMPHSAISIQRPPRSSSPSGQKHREYVRVNGQWIDCDSRISIDGECTLFDLIEAFESMLDAARLRSGTLPDLPMAGKRARRPHPVPTMSFLDPDGPTLKTVPVATILTTYFPDFKDAGENFQCPLPLTPPFWRMYSERVDDFLQTAVTFLTAVEPISALHDIGSLSWLESFVAPIGVSLSFDSTNQIQEQWVCPSLLSSFGRMAVQDLSAGMRVLRCDCCGGPFVTSSYQARYCSQACGWRQRKRRTRTAKIDQPTQE
jgi:hypothetical protein